ncbi:MAG TPA: AsmA family protein [Acetobacteraceae bacterium]|jgi:AsmA protein|nr:AsmA family protein [Acetobacteraceae bacterium]
MKKLLLAILAIFLLLVLGLVAVVLIVPATIDLRPRVEAAVKSATGRDFRIAGPLHVSLVPGLSISASDAHLAGLKGNSDLASIGSFSARMSWLPLLQGRIVIDSLVLQQPVVALSVDKSGAPNWLLQPENAAKPPATPGPSKPVPTGQSTGQDIELRELRLDQGRFTYNDAVTGQSITAKNVTLSGGTVGKVVWQLGMTLNDEPVSGQFIIDSTARLIAGLPTEIDMNLKAKHLTASYKGTAQSEPHPALNGAFDLDIPSVGALFAWLKNPLARDPGPLTMHLETVSDGGKLTLRRASVTGKAIKLTAQADVDTTKTPPSFEARLDIPSADLDAYLPPALANPQAAKPPAASPAEPAAPAPAAPAGWSDVPYDFSALGNVNGHLVVNLGKLRYRGQDITGGAFDLTLGKRVLRLTKGEVHLSGGDVSGQFMLDASVAPAKFQVETSIKGLNLRPLLIAYAGTDRLAGTLATTANLTATGATQRQMIASLAGAGTLHVANGSIYGIDLQKSLREIGKLQLATAPTDHTDFSSLTGSYTIQAGVLTNNDLQMASAAASVSGSGTVSLPPRTLNYALQARLAPAQGIPAALSSVAIPVQITGAWEHPNVQADWSAALGQINLKDLPGNLDKIAPDLNKVLPGLKLPPGLFRR